MNESWDRKVESQFWQKYGCTIGKEGRCSLCRNRTLLVEHHTSYNPEKVIAICSNCHQKIHFEHGFHDELNPFSRNSGVWSPLGEKEEDDWQKELDSIPRNIDKTAVVPYTDDFDRNSIINFPSDVEKTCSPGSHRVVTKVPVAFGGVPFCIHCGRTVDVLKESLHLDPNPSQVGLGDFQ